MSFCSVFSNIPKTYNLGGELRTLATDYVTTIATESEGVSRFDVVYALANGTYGKAVGVAGEVAQIPDIPSGSLMRAIFAVNGSAINEQPPISSGNFVTKDSFGFIPVTMNGLQPLVVGGTYVAQPGVTFISGFASPSAATTFYGQPIKIYNNTGGALDLRHGQGLVQMDFVSGMDYTMQDQETATFWLQKDSNKLRLQSSSVRGGGGVGSEYIAKESFSSSIISGTAINNFPFTKSRFVIASATQIRGLALPGGENTYNGQIVSFRNDTANPVTLKHLSSLSDVKFSFPNEQDYLIQPRFTESFYYDHASKTLYFVGRIGGTQNFQSVTENGATSDRALQLTKIGGVALDVPSSIIRSNFLQTILDLQIGRNIIFGGGGESATAGFYRNGGGTITSGIRTSGKLEYNSFTGDTFTGRQIPHVNFILSLIAATTGSTVSGTKVANIAERDAYNVPVVPFNVFVEDDGDGDWALYMAITTGVGATFVKTSDSDLLNAAMTAEGIKAAYESVANAFSDYYKDKLDDVNVFATENRSDQDTDLAIEAAKTEANEYTDYAVSAYQDNQFKRHTFTLADLGVSSFDEVTEPMLLAAAKNSGIDVSEIQLYLFRVIEANEPVEYNFDVTADWEAMGVTDEASFILFFENQGATDILISDFSLNGGRLSANIDVYINSLELSLNVTEIGAINLESLQTLIVSGNQLTSLVDVAFPDGLQYLELIGNQLTSLVDVAFPDGLQTLIVNNNQLTSLTDVMFPDGLQTLDVSGNQLTWLVDVVFPDGLQSLSVSYNQLTSLTDVVFPDGLQTLYVSYNPLTSLTKNEFLSARISEGVTGRTYLLDGGEPADPSLVSALIALGNTVQTN